MKSLIIFFKYKGTHLPEIEWVVLKQEVSKMLLEIPRPLSLFLNDFQASNYSAIFAIFSKIMLG